MSLLHDEKGALSTARCAFWLVLVWTLVLITLVGADVISLPAAAYGLLTTIFTGLFMWAAGPRLGQYVAPTLSSIVQTVSNAATKRPKDGES